MEVGVTGTQGSHPNFLSYSLNILHNDSSLLDISKDQSFDNLIYPTTNFDRKYFVDHWSETNPIRIIVDNELLWMHQLLCRCTGKFNLDIRYLENNLFDFQKKMYDKYTSAEQKIHLNTNPIMSIFGNMSHIAFKKYHSKERKKLLKFMYKEKIFGKFLPKFTRDSVLMNRPKDIYLVPMTDFYCFEKFDHHVKTLIPTRSLEISKKLHDQFMSNIIHTPENIHQNGSILVESWQEYVG